MPRKSKKLLKLEREIKALRNDPVFLKETVRIQRGEIKALLRQHKMAVNLLAELYTDHIQKNVAKIEMSDPVAYAIKKMILVLTPDHYLFREIPEKGVR
jgi:hypothetical protein